MNVGTFEYKTGDLLKAEENVIAHGCNICGVMGAGVAKQIRTHRYEAYRQYREACTYARFPLGTAQAVATYPSHRDTRQIVFNLATQKNPGPDATPWGVFLAFSNMGEAMADHDLSTVAIPRIGAGIGGLHWETQVVPAIQEAQIRCSQTFNVVVYDLPSSVSS